MLKIINFSSVFDWETLAEWKSKPKHEPNWARNLAILGQGSHRRGVAMAG